VRSAPVRGAWGPVFRARADNTLRGSEAIYAAVSRISNAIASMPLHLYKGHELQVGHPLERIVSLQPNVNFSSFGFIQTMEALRNTEGNAYALIVPDALGVAKRLDILQPSRVRPQRHPETKEMWYVITLDDMKPYPVPGCQLIVVRHISANGEIGIRPIDVLRDSLDYDKQVKDLSLHQLDGVNHGVFLTVPNTGLGEKERQKVIDDFLDAYEKSGQRVVVLEGGLTATVFNQTAIDAKVLDVERITRNRVATVYNIPPHLLGDYTTASPATAEQQMLEFLQLTMTPIVTQWEQELNRKLLTTADYTAGYKFRFEVDAMRRADTATMAEKNQKAIRGGWMKPNDARLREGLPPDPNGDELLVSRDLVPLRLVVSEEEGTERR
jgi:HK97 family phage portal protein